jgi:hypothetical protein
VDIRVINPFLGFTLCVLILFYASFLGDFSDTLGSHFFTCKVLEVGMLLVCLLVWTLFVPVGEVSVRLVWSEESCCVD